MGGTVIPYLLLLSNEITTAEVVLGFSARFGKAKERPLLVIKAHGNFPALVKSVTASE